MSSHSRGLGSPELSLLYMYTWFLEIRKLYGLRSKPVELNSSDLFWKSNNTGLPMRQA